MKTHYVALVPSWLADGLNAQGKPIEIVTNFESLSATISLQDVCFYVALQGYLKEYVGELFDDMESILAAPHNKVWLYENSATLAAQREILAASIPKDVSGLIGVSTPRTYRKTNYTAELAGTNCLAIVGYGMFSEYNHASFVEDCVNVLNKQLMVTEYQKLRVFKEYTKVVQ